MLIGGSTDLYFSVFRDFGIKGDLAGILLEFGHEDYSDPCNVFTLDLWISNTSTSSDAIGVQLNYFLNSPKAEMVVNTGGAGTAIKCRQVAFNNFFGSYSTAAIGIHLIDGYTFGDVWHAVDVENIIGAPVQSDVVTASQQLFVGGTVVWHNGNADGGGVIANTGSNNIRFIGTQFSRNDSGSPHPIVQGDGAAVVQIDTDIYGTFNFAALNIAPRTEVPADAYAVPIIPDSAHVGGMLIKRLISEVPVNRWAALVDNSTESGANAGSKFKITRFDDAGSPIDDPLVIDRADGIATLAKGLATTVGSKAGLFGAVPATQPGNSGNSSPASAGSGGAVLTDTTFTGGIGSTGYTVGQVVAALKTIGAIAS